MHDICKWLKISGPGVSVFFNRPQCAFNSDCEWMICCTWRHDQSVPFPLPRKRLTTAAKKQIAGVQERFMWTMHLLDAGGRKFVVLGLGSPPPPPQEEEEDEGAVGAAIAL